MPPRFRLHQRAQTHPRPVRPRHPGRQDPHRQGGCWSAAFASWQSGPARRNPGTATTTSKKQHGRLAKDSDQAIAALLIDLKQRGMLDDTLVIWGGEFGRTPTVELPTPGSNQGQPERRDHNSHGFTMWMAGARRKRGTRARGDG